MGTNRAKTAITKNSIVSIVQILIGCLLVSFFGLFGIIGGAVSGFATTTDVVMVLLFLTIAALGVYFIIRGTKRRNLIKLFGDYTTRLATDPLHSIDQLAAATGVSVETAKKNILEMINKGYFINAYLDFERNTLVFPTVNASPSSAPQQAATTEYITINCKGCGATNKVQPGAVVECEFCGTSISGRSEL